MLKSILFVTFMLMFAGIASAQQDASNTIQGTEATFNWTPASGPVSNYMVWVMRNNAGWAASPEKIVPDTTATITGVDGERIEVRVAAQDIDGNQGPFSPRSEKLYFSTAPAPVALGTPGIPVCACPEPNLNNVN